MKKDNRTVSGTYHPGFGYKIGKGEDWYADKWQTGISPTVDINAISWDEWDEDVNLKELLSIGYWEMAEYAQRYYIHITLIGKENGDIVTELYKSRGNKIEFTVSNVNLNMYKKIFKRNLKKIIRNIEGR